jgi:hypothetical protein
VALDEGGRCAAGGCAPGCQRAARPDDFTLDQLRAFAAPHIHRPQGLDLVKVQFHLPAFAVKFPQGIGGMDFRIE